MFHHSNKKISGSDINSENHHKKIRKLILAHDSSISAEAKCICGGGAGLVSGLLLASHFAEAGKAVSMTMAQSLAVASGEVLIVGLSVSFYNLYQLKSDIAKVSRQAKRTEKIKRIRKAAINQP